MAGANSPFLRAWGHHGVAVSCYFCSLVVTEIQALGILAGVKARHIAGGGIAGSEGAVVLLLEGYGRQSE